MSHARTSLLLLLLLAGCQRGPSVEQNKSPEKPKAEGDLAFTTLTEIDATKLGIETQPVIVKSVQDHLPLTGWIMAKPGNEVTITAPVAGYVRAVGPVPSFGQAVKKGDALFALEPVLSPLESIQLAALKRGVENDLIKAKSTLDQATIDLKRVEDLYAQKLKQEQEVQQAKLKVQLATEDLAAAQDKQKFFSLATMPVTAPAAGTVLSLPVSPGQYVPASAPLATLIDLNPLWVRVPVPENDRPKVQLNGSVRALRPAGKKHVPMTAKLVGQAPQVDPLRHTVDLYYELAPVENDTALRAVVSASSGIQWLGGAAVAAWLQDPGDTPLTKDEMVTVFVPLGPNSTRSVVPYSAVIFDTHGNTWIYLDRTAASSSKRQYERCRVRLAYMVGSEAVLEEQFAVGDRVVSIGAAQLFSREFFKTPVQP